MFFSSVLKTAGRNLSVATSSQNSCCFVRYLAFVWIQTFKNLAALLWSQSSLSLALFSVNIFGGAISFHHLHHQLLKGLKIYSVNCISTVALLFEMFAQQQCTLSTFSSIYHQRLWWVRRVEASCLNIQVANRFGFHLLPGIVVILPHKHILRYSQNI